MAQHYIRATRPTDQKAREKFSFTAQLYSYGRDSTLVALPRELRAALIIAGKRIRQLQFGRKEDSVLVKLRMCSERPE